MANHHFLIDSYIQMWRHMKRLVCRWSRRGRRSWPVIRCVSLGVCQGGCRLAKNNLHGTYNCPNYNDLFHSVSPFHMQDQWLSDLSTTITRSEHNFMHTQRCGNYRWNDSLSGCEQTTTLITRICSMFTIFSTALIWWELIQIIVRGKGSEVRMNGKYVDEKITV